MRPFVLDDATPAPRPTAPSPVSDPAATESPRARLDERVRRWLEERERYEQRQAAADSADPAGPTSK